MSIYKDIYDVLKADTDLTNLVSTRIYSARLKQELQLPAVVIIRTNTDPQSDMSQTRPNLNNFIIDIISLDKTLEDALALSEKVIDAMYAATNFKMSLLDVFDSYEDDTDRYRTTTRFSIWT